MHSPDESFCMLRATVKDATSALRVGRGPLDGRLQLDAGREVRHPLGGNLHAVAAPGIPHLPSFPVAHTESPEAGDRHALAAFEAGLNPFQERVQRARGLRPGEARIDCHFSDQVSFIHEARPNVRRLLSKARSGVNHSGKTFQVGFAQFVILPYREGAMDQTTVRLIAGILAVALVALIFLRRKKKKGAAEDEF